MPRPPLPLFLLAFACMLLAACGTNPDVDAAVRAASDPKQLLAAYASVTVVICIILYASGDRDVLEAIIDGIRYVGLLSLVVSPLYFLATMNATAGAAMAVSGVLGYACATVIKREEARRNQPPEPKKRGKKAS
jgi:hypothetical protein